MKISYSLTSTFLSHSYFTIISWLFSTALLFHFQALLELLCPFYFKLIFLKPAISSSIPLSWTKAFESKDYDWQSDLD